MADPTRRPVTHHDGDQCAGAGIASGRSMGHGRLFVSFWHIGLENLPEGTFVHRRLMHDEANRLIEEARHAGTLCCASHDDLFAPYEDRERRNHQKLCRVLGEQYGITLTLEDFVIRDEIEGENSSTIRPLAFAQVEGSNRLMLVNCHYVMARERKKGTLEFDIEPESVTFHLFQEIGSAEP
jgi:hypothetical protein